MGDNKGKIKDKNQNDVKGNKEKLKLETRTIEELLKDLRQEKRWSYLQLMEELQRNGVTVNDKEIKKWEYGLEYPSLDVIYKLSGIYKISSQKLIEAKNNSFQKGLNSIHMTFIKWFSYFTGISIKVGYYGLFIIIILAVFFAMFMISENSKEFVMRWRKIARKIHNDFKKNIKFC